MLTAIEGRQRPCASREAGAFAEQLLGFYPAREVNDAQTYVNGVTALLCAYPADFVKRVCDPVTGLPSRLKWLPTLADIREALDAEKSRRDRILANAAYVIAEAARRKREAEDDAKWASERPTSEERAKQVQALLQTSLMKRTA